MNPQPNGQPTAQLIHDSPKMREVRQRYAKQIGQAVLRPNGSFTPVPRSIMRMGQRLRDEQIWQYPIIPGALQVYQDLASTREWVVSGQPRSVVRAVEWINSAQSINKFTGLIDYGFEAYLRRRALDYTLVGMTTMTASDDIPHYNLSVPPLEYLDPTLLSFIRENDKKLKNGFVKPVRPEEKVWIYDRTRQIKAKNLWHHHPIPIGAYSFTAPILYVLPTAVLAWLLRESDMAMVDGRRLRDILLVANAPIADAIEESIKSMLALWSGADPEEVGGVPVVALNNLGQRSVSDSFARLGLSEVPDSLNREEQTNTYVNEIAAALGMALRHFWNNEKTTNRALEIVQEHRQQQKGPSSFVRAEQRLINRSGFLDQFGGVRSQTRFAFREETDMSSMKDRSEVLKNIAEAFGVIMDRLGSKITTESLIAWLQKEEVLPNEIELEEGNFEAQRFNPEDQANTSGEITQESSPSPTSEPLTGDLEKSLDYEEVMMSGNGTIIAKRNRIHTIHKIIERALRKELAEEKTPDERIIEDTPEDLSKVIQEAVEEAETLNMSVVRRLHEEEDSWLQRWKTEQITFKDLVLVDAALYKCSHASLLNAQERKVIDRIALAWESEEENGNARISSKT